MSEDTTFADRFSGEVPANPASEGGWKGGFQKHHLIPTAEANNSSLLRSLAERGAYEHSGFGANGIYLPDNADDAKAAGLARHAGSHTEYSSFVGRILGEIERELDQNKLRLGEDAAYAKAAENVRNFQLFLKDGLVARFDPDTKTIYPKFLLNGQDGQIAGGPGGQEKLRGVFDKFKFADIKQSDVFTSPAYRKALEQSPALFDPNATNQYGERLSQFERAALRDTEVAALARSLDTGKFGTFGKFLTDTASNKTDLFDAFVIGVTGLAYAKTTIDLDNSLQKLQQDIEKVATVDNAATATLGLVAGFAAIGAVSAMFGTPGVVALIGFGAILSIGDLRKAVKKLAEAFPNWDFIQKTDAFFTSAEKEIELAASFFEDFLAGLPEFIAAEGNVRADGNDGIQFIYGSGNAAIHGNGGNDHLIHTGYGLASGGHGDDELLGLFPEFVKKGTPLDPDNPGGAVSEEDLHLELDGGPGDDIIVTLGGNQPIIVGGEGDDTIVPFSSGAVVFTGEGADAVHFAPNILVADAGADDRIYMGARALTGATGGINAESPWALTGLLRYTINKDGELVINFAGMQMYVSNYKGGNGVADPTAGITVFRLGFDAFLAFRGDRAGEFTLSWFGPTLDLIARALFGKPWDANWLDPLVLDLDGDGLELLPPSQGEYAFDHDGDGFGEPGGWVRPDDGLLALDRNGNGIIDDIKELFGSITGDGFADLAKLDENLDGIIDENDSGFAELLIWRDEDGNARAELSELTSLSEHGIVSINLEATEPLNTENAQNQIILTSTFDRADGTTSTIADVGFNIDDYNSVWLGDQTVSNRAAALPNIKGTGEFPDLHISMTLDEDLAAFIEANIGTLTAQNLEDLRDQAKPLLVQWAYSATAQQGKQAHIDVPVKVKLADDGTIEVVDSAWIKDDFWARGPLGAHLYCDLHYCPPTEEPKKGPIIIDTGLTGLTNKAEWRWLEGGVITFLERHLGRDLPLERPASTITATQGGVAGLVEFALNRMDMVAVRLAMQGPLEEYFDGLDYSIEDNRFHPTTDRMLTPVFEAIFARAPEGASETTSYLQGWQTILDVVITEFSRGSDLPITYDFLMANIVAAYDTTGLPLNLVDASIALGVPKGTVLAGVALQQGSENGDILVLGTEDETAEGNGARDVYIVPRVFGSDSIIEEESFADAHGYDLIRFADTRPEEVDARREGLDLVLSVPGTNSELRIVNQFEILKPGFFGGSVSPEWGVEEITFVDGTVWDRVDIAWAVAKADPESTEVRGTPRPDVLDGGAGDDVLIGGDEGDIYLFDTGYGHDTIREIEGARNVLIDTPDFVILGEGAGAAEDIRFSRKGDSLDLVLTLASGDTLTVEKQFLAFHTGAFGLAWQWRIENLIFDDGSFLDAEGIMRRVLEDARTEGDDLIYGFHRDDIIDGGAGDDELSGGEGSDIYRFELGDGNDLIDDRQFSILTASDDILQFGADIAPDDLRFEREGGDLLITVGGDGDSVLIKDQFTQLATSLGGHWYNRIEAIEFQQHPDGAISWQDIMLLVLDQAATDGADVVEGFSSPDLLDGGPGNDLLIGHAGADIYVFGRGAGSDVAHEQIGADFALGIGGDEVRFAGGVGVEDVIFRREGDGLVIELTATGDSLTIRDQFAYSTVGYYIQEIEIFAFSDGSSLSAEDVERKLIEDAVSGGDDVLRGALRDNVLDGGAGDDLLIGEDGSDIYRFGLGYGHDVIDEQPRWINRDNANAVEFVGDIAPDDLAFERAGDDLLITLLPSDETLTVLNEFSARATHFSKIQEYRFEGGETLSRSEILAMTVELNGGPGDDELVGSSEADRINGGEGDDLIAGGVGEDVLTGGPGADTLSGGPDSDTYIFNPGDGADQIEEKGSFSQDVLRLTGTLPDDVQLQRTGNAGGDLVLTFSGRPEDSVTIIGTLSGSFANTVELIRFDDGTEWTIEDIRARLLSVPATDGPDDIRGFDTDDLLQGLGGDDTILGQNGDDILVGGPGNDRLTGNGGSDTYIFKRGDGHDWIVDIGFFSTDRLVIQGYDPSELQLSRHPDRDTHLLIQFTGEPGDQITIEHALTNSRVNNIELVSFDDGTEWTPDDLRRLVQEHGRKPGDEEIWGFLTDDVLEGGDGDDVLRGREGSDTYIYRRGDGDDVVDDDGYFSTDVVRIHDFARDEIIFSRATPNSADLLISFAGDENGSILVKNTLSDHRGDRIELFEFDDGTQLGIEDVRVLLQQEQATSYDDVIFGFYTDDMLSGGGGSDTLSGGEGSDVYAFSLGDGWDHIHDAGYYDQDVLHLSGILPEAAIFQRASPFRDDLLITFVNSPADRVLVESTLGLSRHDTIELIRFDDGTELSISDIRTGILDRAGTIGHDDIRGFETDDLLIGRGGQDYLSGRNGSDIYQFTRGDGQDIIHDDGYFSSDVLKISGYAAEDITFSLKSVGSADLILTFAGNPDDRIEIKGTLEGSRNGTIELIELDDGNSWTPEEYRAAILSDNQTEGNDVVFGFTSDDEIHAGPGTDFLQAGDGDDRYIYNLGDGNDIIRDQGDRFDQDVIAFGPGISPEDISVQPVVGDSTDLLLSLPDGGSILIIDYGTVESGIEEIRFDDGTTWSRNDLLDLAGAAPIETREGPEIPNYAVTANAGEFTIVRDAELFSGVSQALFIERITSVPDRLTAALERGRDIKLTPEPGFSGTEQIELSVRDAAGGISTAVLEMTVPFVNSAPVAAPDTFVIPQDALVEIDANQLLSNVSDIDEDLLQITAVNWASGGSAVLSDTDTLVFEPEDGFHGIARVSYKVADAAGASDDGLIEINVRAAPETRGEHFATAYGSALSIAQEDLLSNDISPWGETLTITGVADGAGGQANLEADGSIRFVPNQGFSGEASFNYQVSDGLNLPVSTTARISIAPAPIVLTANDDAGFTVSEDGELVIQTSQLIANDQQGDAPTLEIANVETVLGGDVSWQEDESILFQTAPDFHGLARFTYELSGASDGTGSAQVFVAITPVNDLPVLETDPDFTTEQDQPLELSSAEILRNDSDADGDPLRIVDVIESIGGLAETDADGNITFTPAAGFAGRAEITYLVSDGQQSVAGTVFVDVQPPHSGGQAYAAANGGVLFGGSLNDRLLGSDQKDYLQGGPGADVLDGGAGRDKADYSKSSSGVTIDLRDGLAEGGDAEGDLLSGIEDLGGSRHADRLSGDESSNELIGRKGDDILSARGGDDWLEGGEGADTLIGGSGRDAALYYRSAAPVSIDLRTGTGQGGDAEGDVLQSIENLTGSHFSDALTGDEGANTIKGKSGDDTLRGEAGKDFLVGGEGADLLDGGAGWDTADYSKSPEAVQIDLLAGTALGGEAEGDSFVSIDTLGGSRHDDVLRGDDSGNQLIGRDGDDVLSGAGGKDFLRGEAGNDVLIGGLGPDSFIFKKSFGNDIVTDFSADEGDVLWFQKQAFSTAAEILAEAEQDGSNTVLDLGTNGTVTLQDVDLTSLTEDDFRFS